MAWIRDDKMMMALIPPNCAAGEAREGELLLCLGKNFEFASAIHFALK